MSYIVRVVSTHGVPVSFIGLMVGGGVATVGTVMEAGAVSPAVEISSLIIVGPNSMFASTCLRIVVQ